MNLILFGFKGSGKTHFGKRLAADVHYPFVDTDDVICDLYFKETKERLSTREIYRRLQEHGFRALENRAVRTLSRLSNTIIALGGGAILDPQNAEFLQSIGELVYLEASPDTLKRRMFKDEAPAFLNDANAFAEMIQSRKPIYESIPSRRLNVDQLDEAAVLASLKSILILENPHGE